MCINNILYTNNSFSFAIEIHNRYLCDPLGLRAPKCGSKQRQQYIGCHDYNVWSSVPLNIRSSESLMIFKRRLKTFILNENSSKV